MSSMLGSKIRNARKQLGLTLEQLAESTDSSKSYIWELENKPEVNPSAEKITKIANKLNLTVEYLLDEGKQEPSIGDIDKAFFRRYSKLDEAKKKKIQDIIKILDDSDD